MVWTYTQNINFSKMNLEIDGKLLVCWVIPSVLIVVAVVLAAVEYYCIDQYVDQLERTAFYRLDAESIVKTMPHIQALRDALKYFVIGVIKLICLSVVSLLLGSCLLAINGSATQLLGSFLLTTSYIISYGTVAQRPPIPGSRRRGDKQPS